MYRGVMDFVEKYEAFVPSADQRAKLFENAWMTYNMASLLILQVFDPESIEMAMESCAMLIAPLAAEKRGVAAKELFAIFPEKCKPKWALAKFDDALKLATSARSNSQSNAPKNAPRKGRR